MRTFDFEFGVEEEMLKLFELFEGGVLSHSTDKTHSFDCDFGVEEEFLNFQRCFFTIYWQHTFLSGDWVIEDRKIGNFLQKVIAYK